MSTTLNKCEEAHKQSGISFAVCRFRSAKYFGGEKHDERLTVGIIKHASKTNHAANMLVQGHAITLVIRSKR